METPVLTVEQKLAIRELQLMDLAASVQHERTSMKLNAYVSSIVPEGYELYPDTLTLSAIPPEPPEPQK